MRPKRLHHDEPLTELGRDRWRSHAGDRGCCARAGRRKLELDPDAKPPAGKTEPGAKAKREAQGQAAAGGGRRHAGRAGRSGRPGDPGDQADHAVRVDPRGQDSGRSGQAEAQPATSCNACWPRSSTRPQLADLAEKHGSAALHRLWPSGRSCSPRPSSWPKRCSAAVNEQLQDPKRLRSSPPAWQTPSVDERTQAYAGAGDARGAAVGPLLDVLADPARTAEHANVRAALAGLGDDAVDPLLGMLEKSEPQFMAQAIQVLADMKAKQASDLPARAGLGRAERSAGPRRGRRGPEATDRPRSRRRARRCGCSTTRGQGYFDRKQPVPGEIDGRGDRLALGRGQEAVRGHDAAGRRRRPALAAQLARDAFALAPDDTQVRLLYLATMLEEAAIRTGSTSRCPRARARWLR